MVSFVDLIYSPHSSMCSQFKFSIKFLLLNGLDHHAPAHTCTVRGCCPPLVTNEIRRMPVSLYHFGFVSLPPAAHYLSFYFSIKLLPTPVKPIDTIRCHNLTTLGRKWDMEYDNGDFLTSSVLFYPPSITWWVSFLPPPPHFWKI